MMDPLVTILTDFGTRDGYVGAIKGVLLQRAPRSTVVDITHDIPPQDVWSGAWALRQAAQEFPPGTIHLAVVDPGVGTARKPLLLESQKQLFIGPDNGLLTLAAPQASRGWHLNRTDLFTSRVSTTFHGRDVFASVAGHLAAGASVEQCGTPLTQWEVLEDPPAVQQAGGFSGQVVYVDRFGNLITNISRPAADVAQGGWAVTLGDRELGGIRQTFGQVAVGHWVAYWGSSDRLEIAIRDGNAAAAGVGRGAEVRLCHV